MIESEYGLIGKEATLNVDWVVRSLLHVNVTAEGTRVQPVAQHVEYLALREDHQEFVQAL